MFFLLRKYICKIPIISIKLSNLIILLKLKRVEHVQLVVAHCSRLITIYEVNYIKLMTLIIALLSQANYFPNMLQNINNTTQK